MIALVGYSGFVGSNIAASAGDEITAMYNSKNIEDAYGTKPELLIYSGLRAEKYLANNDPGKDMEFVIQAQENIRKINPQKLVLISTIDVFKTPNNVDETSAIEVEGLHAYGYNRYQLELWVRENYSDALIIRLPGLYGRNLKKNFIYDYINIIPSMLTQSKMQELYESNPEFGSFYDLQSNGFFKVKTIIGEERARLKSLFEEVGFSALDFTDSRSKYQFYNLQRLWPDIKVALEGGLTLWHPATEPISAGELFQFLCGKPFDNRLSGVPAAYDYKTQYAALWNSSNGYICDKATVLRDIETFVMQMQGQQDKQSHKI